MRETTEIQAWTGPPIVEMQPWRRIPLVIEGEDEHGVVTAKFSRYDIPFMIDEITLGGHDGADG